MTWGSINSLEWILAVTVGGIVAAELLTSLILCLGRVFGGGFHVIAPIAMRLGLMAVVGLKLVNTLDQIHRTVAVFSALNNLP